jgi:thymidylate synthase (FAD)
MSCRLVALTKPCYQASFDLGPDKTSEDFIAYVARVSNPSNQNNQQTAPKLLKYLIENKHWSPFEMVSMTVEIKTSRAIAQQILRHRSFSFQEFSQRYAQATDFVTYPARRQDVKNRQNSIDDMSSEDRLWFTVAQDTVQTLTNDLYNEALSRGIAKEQARFLLPLSTATTLYMSGTVRSWIHYIQLRADSATQLEHRQIAEEIKLVFCEQFPSTSEALGWNIEK